MRLPRSMTPLLVLLALWIGCAGPATAQTFQTAAPQAVLMDAETGAILLDVAGDRQVSPASLVKLMTAEVIFREISAGRLKLEDEFVVSEHAWRRGGAPAGGSAMFLVPNARVKIGDLLLGILVVSGNDAAITLAEGMSGSEAAFATLMNERARELGLKNSTFRNANGWSDPEQRVTMRDMVRLADHIIRTYPDLYKLFGQREMTWNKARRQNLNPLLTMDVGADGLKTGFLEESGYALVGSAVQNGQRLILAMSGLKTARDRQIEAKKLLDWGFRSFEVRTLLDAGTEVGEAAVFGGAKPSIKLKAKTAVRLPVPRGALDKVTARISYRGPVRAPVPAETELGQLVILRNGVRALEVPVVTAEAVDSGTLSQRAWDSAYELGRSVLRNGFRGTTGKGEPKP